MKLAAAAILVGSKATAAEGIPILEEALQTAASDRERTNLQLALALGYSTQDNFLKLLDVASALVKQVPESKQAFIYNVEALMGLDRYDDAIAVAGERLKLLDNDRDALSMKMGIEANRGNYAAARAWGEKLVALGKEDAELLNDISWFALFTGKVDDADIANAVKATQMAADNPHILHTLACLYAERGDTRDAREVLLRAMDDLNLDEPNDDFWYVLGRIAEQYGERDIAIADYLKLKKPDETLAVPTSSWRLAQTRLQQNQNSSTQ